MKLSDRAQKKNLEFKLSKNEFDEISNKNCYYCKKINSNSHTNGIDRKDNTKGYNVDNCVSCCTQCNCQKSELSDSEFIEHCIRVSKYNCKHNLQIPEIETVIRCITKRNNKDIEKTKIIIAKQQDNLLPPKIYEAVAPHIPNTREYTKGSNIPKDYNFDTSKIPKYCYYIKETKAKGNAFAVGRNHPLQKGKKSDWTTTKSKKISLEDKFKQLMTYLDEKKDIETEI
jgi:hypothetical protein